jgi:hypothetical protein
MGDLQQQLPGIDEYNRKQEGEAPHCWMWSCKSPKSIMVETHLVQWWKAKTIRTTDKGNLWQEQTEQWLPVIVREERMQ